MLLQTQVGPQVGAKGAYLAARSGPLGDLIQSELHGRFYEQNYQGNMFSTGMTLTSISNATFSTGTLGATCTPIVGLWNPLSSTINAAILQARLQAILTALQCTGAGAFVWAVSLNNAVITTGLNPYNRRTLAQNGSQCKGFAGTALTGLTNNLVVMEASALNGGSQYNASLLGTAVGFMPPAQPSIENIDGSFIVPPGGVLALLCTTNPPVAVSAASSLIWEEVPL